MTDISEFIIKYDHNVNCYSDLNMSLSLFVLQCTILVLLISSTSAFKQVDVKVSFDIQVSSWEFRVLLFGVEWFQSSVNCEHQKWWRDMDNKQQGEEIFKAS